jgi:hypothetical protein
VVATGFAAVPIFCTVSRTPRSSAKIVSNFGSVAVAAAGAPVGGRGGELCGFAGACGPCGDAARGSGIVAFFGSVAVAVGGAPVGRWGGELSGFAGACSLCGDAARGPGIVAFSGSTLWRTIVPRCFFDFGSFDFMVLSDIATLSSIFELLIAILLPWRDVPRRNSRFTSPN